MKPTEIDQRTETILAEITLAEAALIRKVREYPFGQLTVYITDGSPIRVVIGGSEMLSPADGKVLSKDDLGAV